jgi:hypothetical protein
MELMDMEHYNHSVEQEELEEQEELQYPVEKVEKDSTGAVEVDQVEEQR